MWKARDVADYETLFELLISDRLKGTLPQGPLNYVLTQEGEGWYTSEKVASLADVFVNNRATIVGQKAADGNRPPDKCPPDICPSDKRPPRHVPAWFSDHPGQSPPPRLYQHDLRISVSLFRPPVTVVREDL